ncbi:hypothetical protein PYCCODRAFT_319352 [Trametes coccinea BRFM310]|uniref:Uncharacterized protein n=1 Tax=Trametes coccinea (strain BRFM310) TaxID=1353009 RepID=A0A1Y2IQN8_TRAC3|nr:hypothetical protein PYCCODRAFT_319352 [Trametes coccinea BRFM310]
MVGGETSAVKKHYPPNDTHGRSTACTRDTRASADISTTARRTTTSRSSAPSRDDHSCASSRPQSREFQRPQRQGPKLRAPCASSMAGEASGAPEKVQLCIKHAAAVHKGAKPRLTARSGLGGVCVRTAGVFGSTLRDGRRWPAAMRVRWRVRGERMASCVLFRSAGSRLALSIHTPSLYHTGLSDGHFAPAKMLYRRRDAHPPTTIVLPVVFFTRKQDGLRRARSGDPSQPGSLSPFIFHAITW